MIFPSYSELEQRSTDRFASASIWSTLMNNVAFVVTGVAGLLIFGRSTSPDILENIATRPGQISLAIRVLYILVLLFHIPYILFATKENVLVVYDELANRSLSTHLEEKLSDHY